MSRLKIKTLEELLGEPPKSPPYIIRPLLPVGGVLVIAGDVKTFKSYLALNLGYQLATGGEFLGWKVLAPNPVLYIEMEVGEPELYDRGNQIHKHHGDLVAARNLHIISRDLRVQFDTKEGIELFREAIQEVRPSVVIVDPIVEFHSQDENRAIEIKKMLWPARRILQENHAALVIVHHTAKTSEFRPGNNPASIRGSYLAGMANSIINIEKPIPDGETVRLHFTMRSAKSPKPLTLTFDEMTGGFK